MTTRAAILNSVRTRLGDTGDVWDTPELTEYVNSGIQGLYPTYYQREVAETVAGDGPTQTMPAGARNLYFVGHKRQTSTRVRLTRGWKEGNGEAYIPRTGIAGDMLVWAWTAGWQAPSSDAETIDIPSEAEDVVVLRACVAALEGLFTNRVKKETYHAIQLRTGVSEEDLDLLIGNLRDSIDERVRLALPLPEVQG